MKILALDCSTEACSAALLIGNQIDSYEISERYELAAKSHTERLLPMVDELLVQAQISLSSIDAIAFGCGPGSFTGLRICASVVQGLAFGADTLVIPVSSLAALAHYACQSTPNINEPNTPTFVLSAIDARMDEIYWGVYSVVGDLVELQGLERLTAPEQLELPELLKKKTIAVGTGLHYSERIACKDSLNLAIPKLLPRASSVARIAYHNNTMAQQLSAEQAIPTYLRDQVAWKKQ